VIERMPPLLSPLVSHRSADYSILSRQCQNLSFKRRGVNITKKRPSAATSHFSSLPAFDRSGRRLFEVDKKPARKLFGVLCGFAYAS
jgi:hypothetical protein